MEKNSNPRKGAGGPRTRAGKNRSSRNAVKDGLFAKLVVEQDEAYKSACEIVCDECGAEGVVEGMLGHQIWQLLCERQCIDAFAREQWLGVDAELALQEAIENGSSTNVQGDTPGERQEPEYVRWIRPALRAKSLSAIKHAIQHRGLLPQKDLEILNKLYGRKPTVGGRLVVSLYATWEEQCQMETDASALEHAKTWITERILHAIESEIAFQEGTCTMLQNWKMESLPKTFMPSEERQQKIARSRVQNERSLKRALESLAILKAMKRLKQST
jgi:hypothetical protein